MKWRATQPVADRCGHALAWCRTFAGQWDEKRLKKLTVSFAASPYMGVVAFGVTFSTWNVPHTCKIFLNTACNGGGMYWEEAPVYISKTAFPTREAAEAAASDKLQPGQVLGELRIIGKRWRFAVWGHYFANSLKHAAVWVFAHELWHWLAGTKQVKGPRTEQYARAAACRIADLYAAGRSPAAAADYLKSNALDVIHDKE